MKLVHIFAISALLTPAAFANSIVCSSSDSKLSFNQDTSNGGPYRPMTESLVLNGETLISFTFPGGADFKVADTNFSDHPVWSKTTTNGNIETTLSLTNLVVIRNDAGLAPLFSDLVFCRSEVYVGPPVP